jgi:hypothetical protein
MFGLVGNAAIHARVKPENDRVRGRSQIHVRVGDGAHGAVNDFEHHLVRFDFLERLHNRFHGTLRVGLDHHFERFVLL